MNFRSSAVPLHFVSKLSGLTIFSIDPENFKTKITIFDFLLIFLTTAICYQLNVSFWNSFSFNTYYLPNKIIKCYFPIVLYGKFLINIISMVWTLVCRNKIARLFSKIYEIDEMVRIPSKKTYPHHKLYILAGGSSHLHQPRKHPSESRFVHHISLRNRVRC